MKTIHLIVVSVCLGLTSADLRCRLPQEVPPEPRTPLAAARGPDAIDEACRKGAAWLVKHQAADGSWGKTYTLATSSFACLSFLAASDEPFDGEVGKALTRGLRFLVKHQTDGMFVKQGHTWIHGQGFATLALSEALGRALRCETKPDLDLAAIRNVVTQAVEVIARTQSTSGGWWYTHDSPGLHEGSTTVCAVQALVSAANYGIKIRKPVLRRGFEYLKKCQNPDGGFDYKLGPGTTSMKEGTAGGVATLGLMRKFDFAVMMNGYKFLQAIKPSSISAGRFPYYGHFYGALGMRLLGQEMTHLAKEISGYLQATSKDLLSWQQEDGSWPVKSWMKSHGEPRAYSTAFATLTLLVRSGRLSIFNRTPPKAN